MKAYEPMVSVSDPKQRRAATELNDYCNGDRFKLFSKAENRAVDVLDVGGRRLKSVPSAGLRA